MKDINAVPELSRLIAQFTGERVTQLSGIRPGVWYVRLASGPFVVKLRRSRAHLADEQKVLQSLSAFGVPVEQLLNIWPVDADQSLCRFSYVRGDPLPLDIAWARGGDLGRQIGALHQGLATMTGKPHFPAGILPATIIHAVVPVLIQTGSPRLKALTEQLLAYEGALWALQELPRQLIHRDAHIGNMLFRDSAFSGWVDFDLLETNFRIFDVCYCAAGLLAARFTDDSWRNQWILAVREMVASYGEVVVLSAMEVEAVWIAMVAIEALFAGISAQRDPQAAEGTAAICHWLFEQRHRWPR